MSKLQVMVNKLIDIVISYRRIQKPYLSDVDIKTILAMPLPDLIVKLEESVNSMLYKERQSLMHFFIYAIKQVKPLVDKPEHLSKDEKIIVNKTLLNLLTQNAILLQRSQNSPDLSITYGDTTENIQGFTRLGGYSLCQSGQIIKSTLFASEELPKLTETSDFQAIINHLIVKHQKPLLQEAKIKRLQAEITQLKEQLLEKDQQHANYQSLASTLETERQTSQLLFEENQMLQQRLLTIESNVADLQQRNQDLNQQMTKIALESPPIALQSSLIQSQPHRLMYHSSLSPMLNPFFFASISPPIKTTDINEKEPVKRAG